MGAAVLPGAGGALPLRATLTIPLNAPARTVRLLLDGKEIVPRMVAGPGKYTAGPERRRGRAPCWD